MKHLCLKSYLVIGLLLFSLIVRGNTYFVATTGDDGNDGSYANPWKTVAHAVANLSAGDTLELRGGTFYEHNIVMALQGTASDPIIIESYQNESAVIDGGVDTFLNAPNTQWVVVIDSINLYKSVDTFTGSYVNAWLEDDNVHLIEYEDSLNLESSNFGPMSGFTPVYQGPGIRLQADGHLSIRLEQNPNDLIDPDSNAMVPLPADVNPNNNNVNVFFSSYLFKMMGVKHLKFNNITFAHSKYLFDVRDSSRYVDFDSCSFKYGSYGFVVRSASNFTFSKCTFDNGVPQYVYWSDVKMGSCEVSEAYPEFESKAITSDNGITNFTIKDCLFENGFDGIGIKDGSSHIKILHNYFIHFRDDAIDLRAGIDDVEIADNVLWEIGSGISMTETSNTTVGQVYIHHNIIDNSILQHGGRVGNCKESNWPVWTTLDPFGSHGKDELAYWKVYNNTIVSRKSGYSSPECGVHSVLGIFFNYFLNNLIYTFDDRIIFRGDTAVNGAVYDGNFVYREDTAGLYMYYRFGDGGNYNSLADFRANSGTSWELLAIQANPRLDTFAILHLPFDSATIRERYRPRNTLAYTAGSSYDSLNWYGTDSIYYRGSLPPGELLWLGANVHWNDSLNWSNGIIPDEAYRVQIPKHPVHGDNFPVISDSDTAKCFNIALGDSALITVRGVLQVNQ